VLIEKHISVPESTFRDADTSLAAEVTVVDLFHVAQQKAAVNFDPLLMYCEAAFIYLMICTVLSSLQNRIESRLERFAT
jgi:cystine transport system permease protein